MSRDDDWQAVFANFLGLGAKMLSWAATSESTAANKIDTASAMLGFRFGSFGRVGDVVLTDVLPGGRNVVLYLRLGMQCRSTSER